MTNAAVINPIMKVKRRKTGLNQLHVQSINVYPPVKYLLAEVVRISPVKSGTVNTMDYIMVPMPLFSQVKMFDLTWNRGALPLEGDTPSVYLASRSARVTDILVT